MRFLKSILAMFLLIGAIAFSYSNTQIQSAQFGVCGQPTEHAIVLLILNEDGTFKYFDKSNAVQKVEANGKWQQNGNRIQLNAANDVSGFRVEWKLEKDNRAIKSRQGISFYRLVNNEKCRPCGN